MIVGTFEKEYFRDYKTGYAKFEIKDDSDNIIVCSGRVPELVPGITIEVDGTLIDNDIKVDTYNVLSTDTAVIKFLETLSMKKFTHEDAIWFATYFSCGLFTTIANTPILADFEKLLPKEKQKFAKTIYRSAKKFLIHEELFRFLLTHGGTYQDCRILTRVYKTDALRLFKSYPYNIGLHWGVSFNVCDLVAKESGRTRNDTERLNGIIFECAEIMKKNGHTFIPADRIRNITARILKDSPLGDVNINFILARIHFNNEYVIENGMFTTRAIIESEDKIIVKLKKMVNAKKQLPFKEDKISEIENICNIKLSPSQINSFKMLSSTGVKILQGGPGTGKTTVVNALITYIKREWPDKEIHLCAPTGCAAQNMMEKTHMPAKTIHRLLGFAAFENYEKKATKVSGDVFIVDEMSMLDEEMFELLLSSIEDDVLIIFIGDIDQLPSVGYGSVMNDLIESEYIEVYDLEGTHRQKAGSAIISNAKAVKYGKTELIDYDKDDFTVYEVADDGLAMDLAVNELKTDEDVICLCPTKKEVGGTFSINERYRPNEQYDVKYYDSMEYHLHDRVIMQHNNYEAGYYNGDIGEIIAFDEKGIEIEFPYAVLYITNGEMSDMLPAYAITIHKSQGSEYENVVIVLTKLTSKYADRKTLYTAITRAKKTVSIISEKNAFEEVITKKPKTRYSRLKTLV